MNFRLNSVISPRRWADISAAITVLAMAGSLSMAADQQTPTISVAKQVPAEVRTSLYVSNREPLLPSPLVKLPIGSIVPRGWLRAA